MKNFYIGKCPKCGTINAGALADTKDCATDLKEMIDSGLTVEKISADTVDIRSCEHCGKWPE